MGECLRSTLTLQEKLVATAVSFVLVVLVFIGVLALLALLIERVIESLHPEYEAMIEEHLRTFDVVLRHKRQEGKLRYEMRKVAREHQRRK